ncbi:MAG TPA: response regulator [Paenibacillus sp.]|uniref:response regulator n=1 Tax=Paenibacillus sp. TaxID=58172 RepID=UPI002C07CC8E|nr:response regulator [Paenibacillus sp.]HUC91387.1 response regulator [Paenibacillus sp.]
MLKLIIVDDEPLIREGLKSMPWEQWGCVVTGEAEDGEEGLAVVDKVRPDIIITDIRMPGMDGLAFAEKVKERFPETEILMLTGYQDFNYAKSAMHIGIRDLLLKPTKFDELEQVVRKLVEDIRNRTQSQHDYDRLRIQMQSAVPLLRNKLIHDLLHGNLYTPSVIKGRLALFGITIERFAVMSIQIDDRKSFEQLYSSADRTLFEFAVMNIAEEMARMAEKKAIIDFDRDLFSIVLSFDEEDGAGLCDDVAMNMGLDIQKGVRTFLPFTVSIGISDTGERIEKINEAYLQSVEALNHKFFLGDDAIVRFRDIAATSEIVCFFGEEDKQTITNSLRVGDIAKVREVVEQIKRNAADSPGIEIQYLKISLMELALGSVRMIGQFNPNLVDSLMQAAIPFSRSESIATLERLFSECLHMFESIAEIVSAARQTNLGSSVDKIMKMIESEYEEDISLDMLAERFKLSTAYLSRLIRKETGKTFMENLTEVRMERAKFLLTNGSKKVYEVAGLVGYKDLSYFIQVFKKRYGMTPNEFKEQQSGWE